MTGGAPNSYKKYLQATDFIEMQTSGVLACADSQHELISLVMGLIDHVDFEKLSFMLLESDNF